MESGCRCAAAAAAALCVAGGLLLRRARIRRCEHERRVREERIDGRDLHFVQKNLYAPRHTRRNHEPS